MNFITSRELRTKGSKLWEELNECQQMVVTNNGKPVAMLIPVSESGLEADMSTLIKIRAMQATESMQMRSVALGLHKLSMSEINGIINEVRNENRS